jgi:protocatechuate 3,4-dioxygenase beta subunit
VHGRAVGGSSRSFQRAATLLPQRGGPPADTYQGRATHIHVQVFVNGAAVKTTQIAFPEDVSAAVYRTAAYASHGQNSTTNSRDNVFADGSDHELAVLSGDPTAGYTAALTVGVAV